MAHSKHDSEQKKTMGKAQKKDAAKTNGASAVGACKQTKTNAAMVTPMTKPKKKNTGSGPLFVDPPDDAYAPYFKEFEGKRAPNFTAVEDLVLCRAYTAVSKDPTVGTDQSAETFWKKVYESFVLLSGYEVENSMI